MKKRKAFTLVELLVVIGVITVLIGILLPALSKARQSAMTVSCMASLREIGQGFLIYSEKNGGAVPPRGDYKPSTGTANGWVSNSSSPILGAGTHWYEYLGETKATPDGSGPNAWNRQLFIAQGGVSGSANFPSPNTTKSFGYTEAIWHCGTVPTEQIYGASANPSFGWGGGYGVNVDNIFFPAVPAQTTGSKRSGSPKFTKIKHAAEVMLCADAGRPTNTKGVWLPWMEIGSPAAASNLNYPQVGDANFSISNNQVAFRHPKSTANILFFDGHVQTMRYDEVRTNPMDMFAAGVNGYFNR